MLGAIKRNIYKIKDDVHIRLRIKRYAARKRLSKTNPGEILGRYLQDTPPGSRGLNLACGTVPFKGWLNLDFDRPEHVDIMWDLRQKLPFIPDNAFDFVYHEHFMEHIDRKSALELARECFRVLKPGGRIRIALPDLDKVIADYMDNKAHPEVHGEFKRHYGELFLTRGELLDIAMRGWGHTYLYNYEDLSLLLSAAGFGQVKRALWKQSDTAFLAGRESRTAQESGLIVEGVKA